MTTTANPIVSRGEWTWLGVAMLVGAALRLGNLQHIAVEHFDEAVYAANLLFPAELGGQHPLRPLFAPPLIPAVIEWTTIFGQMLFGDIPPWWPMLPGLIAGLATIPSAWWIGRQWFSPQVGVIAALVLAGHEYHAAYSRTALTDVPLTFLVLWAVHWFWRALQSGAAKEAVLAGVFTGLAWWTKYNGWLPLAVAAAGGLFWQLISPPAERNWTRVLRAWGIGAATAFVLWLPVVWDCQKVGGYAKVAENHRRYLQGFAHWPQNLRHGYENFDEFVGWLTASGLLLGIASCWPARNASRNVPCDPAASSARLLGECLAGAWFWGLFVATPLYHPYSRLWTPWLAATALLMALTLGAPSFGSGKTLAGLYRLSLRAAGLGCVALVILAALSGRPPGLTPACWERRDAYRQAARQFRTLVPSDDAAIVVGESDLALWFQLRRLGVPATLAGNFEFADGRWNRQGYLLLGPLSQRIDNIQENFARRRDRFERLEDVPISLSRVSLLDLESAGELARHPDRRSMTIQVFRPKTR